MSRRDMFLLDTKVVKIEEYRISTHFKLSQTKKMHVVHHSYRRDIKQVFKIS